MAVMARVGNTDTIKFVITVTIIIIVHYYLSNNSVLPALIITYIPYSSWGRVAAIQ